MIFPNKLYNDLTKKSIFQNLWTRDLINWIKSVHSLKWNNNNKGGGIINKNSTSHYFSMIKVKLLYKPCRCPWENKISVRKHDTCLPHK